MTMNRAQLVAGLLAAIVPTAAFAQVPRPTVNLVGSYFYNASTGGLDLSNLFVRDVQYLDGTTSTSDAIVTASFAVTGLTFIGMDTGTGDALFTDGSIVVSNGSTTFMTADLVNVRLAESGFGDFGNINVGFGDTNVTNLVFGSGTGSQFVDEFAALIAPAGVPDVAAVQMSMLLLFPFGQAPATFAENFQVSSIGSVLGVFDGAPTCFTPPVITSLDGDSLVVPANVEVCLVGDFTDLDTGEYHIATWDFGDGSAPVLVDPATSPVVACHAYGAGGNYTVTFTVIDDCGNTDTATIDVTVLNTAACFGINRLKIGTKQPRCKGITLLEVTSTVGVDQLVAVYVPEEGTVKLASETIVDDGVHGPVTIHTSCSQPLEIGDVFGDYTVTDVVNIFDEESDYRGNEVEIRGSFDPGVPIDLSVDDVSVTIDDGAGHAIEFTVPAGGFELEGHDEGRRKFEFRSTTATGVEIKAKFNLGRCDFRFKLKGVLNTNDFVGTAVTVRLQVGNTVGEETVAVVDKHNHLEHKKKPKLKCCPDCHGISFLQVTSDQGVLEFVPEPGQTKLPKETVVDDGVNPPVTIHTSCSQPIDIGDGFGDYTISDVVKILE